MSDPEESVKESAKLAEKFAYACISEREAALRGLDFTSWHSLILTLVGLATFTLVGVGIRLLAMSTIQQRRERMNRQINERLRTLIAAYRTLGGSFTGTLAVDPTHLRELRVRQADAAMGEDGIENPSADSDRGRRIRDAVEAALSDVILLGTEEHVRLAAKAVNELAAGRPVHTHALVVALRDFIRRALDLDPMPSDVQLPMQGPARPTGNSRSTKEEKGGRSDAKGGAGGLGGEEGGLGLGLAVKPGSNSTDAGDDRG